MTKIKSTDLTKLSRAEKLALIDAIEEKQRRALERRPSYSPNPGQLPVHQSKAKIRAVFAGNGGGKTALGVNEALWAANGYNPITKEYTPVPARVIVVLDQPRKIDDLWLPEIKKWYPLKQDQLHKRGKPYYEQIRFDNGSEILFMFHDMDDMVYESIELDYAIFDEPPPRKVYVGLRRGGRKKGRQSRYLIIGTPIAAAWLRKEIYEPWSRGEAPEIECFRYSSFVNEDNLGDGELESFSRSLSEKERRIRLEGEFFDLEGLALAHLFGRSTHVIQNYEWNKAWPVVVAIDPHPRKAHTAVMIGVTPHDKLVVLKEMSSRAIPSKFAEELKEWYAGFRVVDIVCDSLGSSELTGGQGNMSFIQVLREKRVAVRATTYDEKKDEAWIQMIQEVLAIPLEPDNLGQKEPRLKVCAPCKGVIADFETVEWETYKNIDEFKPKLAIGNKDFLSCVKYALAAQPKFSKGRERVIRSRAVGWNNRELSRQQGRDKKNGW
jgi:hypothetical protein